MRPLFLKLPLPNLSLSTLLRLSESRRDGILSSPLSEAYADDLYLRLDGSNKMVGDLVLGDGVVSNNILPNENWTVKPHSLGNSAQAFYGIYSNFMQLNTFGFSATTGSFSARNIAGGKVNLQTAFGGYSTPAVLETIAAGVGQFRIPVAGDITHRLDSQGVILTDRTTATQYRLLVDNGVLDIEAA